VSHKDALKHLFPLKELEGVYEEDVTIEGNHLDAVEADIDGLLDEMFPHRATVDTIDDWEESYGIVPDPADTLQERRDRVLAKRRARGSLKKQYFIDLAAAWGYAITIEGYRAPRCNEAVCGSAVLAPEGIVYVWKVIITEQNLALEKLFNELKPAWTLVEFEYVP